jgi:cytochrome P450
MVTRTADAESLRAIFRATRDRMDPSPELYQAIAETPLIEIPDGRPVNWIALGMDEVKAILGDTVRFSNEPDRGGAIPGNLLQLDPPEHTRIRRLLQPEFTPRRMRALQSMVEEIVVACVDDMERAGSPGDLMRRFAWPITALVSCEMFGMPRDDALEMMRLHTVRSTGEGSNQRRAFLTNDTYGKKLVERARKEPGDDLMGRLVREHGDDLSDDDLHGIFDSVVFAQLEGTAQMLGMQVLALLEHPDQLALLRERPELMDRAVEELMRYVSPIPIVSPRRAVEDVPLSGRVIKKGDSVQCSLLAANRALPRDEDGLDITRENASHMALGHGAHFCVGAGLGRLELRLGLAELLRRFPNLRLAVEFEELRFRFTSPQFGVNALPVAW